VSSEFLAYGSGGGAWVRAEAVRSGDRLLESRDFEVIAGDDELYVAAFDLFRRWPDKTDSMVDCMSMVICRRMKITEGVRLPAGRLHHPAV
jgi:hypothetical protein